MRKMLDRAFGFMVYLAMALVWLWIGALLLREAYHAYLAGFYN